MMEEIISGVNRAVKIENSGVKKVFTPHIPIKTYQNLIGRAQLSNQLISCLISTGRHALLFGDRGVGKSSLANASADLIIKKVYKGEIFKKSCDSTDTFASLFEQPLRKAGINIELAQSNKESEIGAEITGGIKSPGFESQSKLTGKKKQSQTHKHDYNLASPSWIGQKIKDLNCLIVIDEFDAIINEEEKFKVAELLKYLSDNSETVTILLVGIAKSAVELTAGHPSVRRCLMELHVDRMSDVELRKILIDGSQKLGLIFQDDVIDEIVSISAGYAYFTHLIALKCSEEAIIANRKHINIKHLKGSLKLAVSEAESTMREAYYSAIRGKHSAEYKNVLYAAATCSGPEFTVNEISRNLSTILGIEINPKAFTRFMQSATCEEGKKIFRRIRQGVYQFSDPRTPSFIRMLAETPQDDNENISDESEE